MCLQRRARPPPAGRMTPPRLIPTAQPETFGAAAAHPAAARPPGAAAARF
jgi:hypothetical protein